ncbi:MAG: hypothetical protein JHC26_12460 [Thermofilum sp.]|jgi:hypothetical protein|uniref:hypothetical protein n=1 Tax=Thermofilum sp. TaxID=1961369 RepID=UPI00258FF6F4|nr:hypothetical protein [Thermofilum sp.]MCI4409898.1 hypothetical protein [Thermofilum sp.]
MDIRLIRLKRLEDLIHVLNVVQVPIVHHLALDSRHIYFIPFFLSTDSSIIYFYENERRLEGKFLLFNNFTGEVDITDKWISDTRFTIIPIIDVEYQNVFPEKQLLSELRNQHAKEKREKEKKSIVKEEQSQ